MFTLLKTSCASAKDQVAQCHRVLCKYDQFVVTKNTVEKIGRRTKITWQGREKMNRDKKQTPKIDAMSQSLASKGFLRSTKAYTVTGTENAIIDEIYAQVVNNSDENYRMKPDEKFQLLALCSEKIGHSVTNSSLHTIKTLKDIKNYYSVPVNKIVPLDALKQQDLPKNLHILQNYHRFHPDTDTMFDGVSAFPGSSTLVTGLKTKKKYEGYKAEDIPLKY